MAFRNVSGCKQTAGAKESNKQDIIKDRMSFKVDYEPQNHRMLKQGEHHTSPSSAEEIRTTRDRSLVGFLLKKVVKYLKTS